jgi:AP2 domain.
MSQKAGQKSRGNGEGSIRQRKDGRWEAKITIGQNDSGSQKMKYFSGKTRQEAAEKLSTYRE